MQDTLIARVDGLRGFPGAIATVYPKTQVQLCIVHLMRDCLNFVSWKERKTMALDLKHTYHAATAEEAVESLNMKLRKVIKSRDFFLNEESALKLI